ncbi:hypothetical protein ANANG_G00028970 [Anguilla anguilla]|uniref:Alkylated DNA repair protein AlkB homologue 8 N-terminal domain-containing protein n=1 Tax=Anguilla anguilla TaxID=7936 RepID=A0A9D3S8C5_ANGAN|nr:hypothetical protein ANANG_G00028970 [Anguilla anguilla]
MVVDFRRNAAPPAPITLCDSPVDTVESFCFLGTIITQDLKWELNISSLTKKAQQRMYFLRQLKKFNLPMTMMVHFYTAIIESILTSSITICEDHTENPLQRHKPKESSDWLVQWGTMAVLEGFLPQMPPPLTLLEVVLVLFLLYLLSSTPGQGKDPPGPRPLPLLGNLLHLDLKQLHVSLW